MKNSRHTKIIEILENYKIITVKELAEKLECTEMTVRRDLDYLQTINLVKREHGCAYLIKKTTATYYEERISQCKKEKDAIAKAALNLIEPNNVICTDSSTSAHALICQLPDDIPLTVITTNLVSGVELCKKDNVQILIAGGMVNHQSISTANYIATDFLNRFNADIGFVSAKGFHIPGGAYEHTIALIESKQALLSISKKIVLLVDHTKFTTQSLCLSVPLKMINIIITDNGTPEEYISRAAILGKEVIVVDPDTDQIVQHYNPTLDSGIKQ